MCRKEAGVGQSYAHCRSYGHRRWAEPNSRNVKHAHGVCVHFLIVMYRCIHLLLLLVTMLDDTKAAVMRSNDGLHLDNCCFWHIAHMLANLSNLCARFLWARTFCFCKIGFCQRLLE